MRPRETIHVARSAVAADEEELLDRVFEQALSRLEEGSSLDAGQLLAELSAGREALRSQIARVVELAGRVATTGRSERPSLRDYTLLRELGHGGMGTVYLARQERLGRLVALKVLPQAWSLSSHARQRFLSEARAIARLDHPHIVAIHDVIEQDGTYAYAMEWVDGQTLADVIAVWQVESPKPAAGDTTARGGSRQVSQSLDLPYHLDPASVCRLGVAIARALAAVHAAGLVHRDVKPSNILIRSDTGAPQPLLSDFGLVREAGSTLTQTGHFAGTPAYAAPEQLRGDNDAIDARSDVYSLGVTLFHALARRLPFDGRTPDKLSRQIERGAAAPLRKIDRRVPRELETVVSKAMDADPARRYQTAGELADDLERLLNLQPIRARPAGVLTRAVELARRNRGALLAAMLGSAASLALAASAVVYVFLVPGWVAAHARDARLALLDPAQANSIVSELYWGRVNTAGGGFADQQRVALERALSSYDAALRFAPFDAAIRRERDVVAAVRAEIRARSASEGLPQNIAPQPPLESLAGASRPDSSGSGRLTGFHAYLAGDYRAAIDAWTRWEMTHDPLAEPDPLVDAALGILYLFDEQPARAYPRLQVAVEAFPNVGFLLEYLADAAAKCGDTGRARRWLEQSSRLPRRDPLGAAERVNAAVLAAEGRTAEAIAAYRSCPANGLPQIELAGLLAREGRWKEALTEYLGLVGRFADSSRVLARLRVCADRWWASISERERLRHIRAALDDPWAPGSLPPLLRAYAPAAPDPRSLIPDSSPPSRHSFAAASLSSDFPALASTDSSPFPQSVTLSTLAQRMEISNMTKWNRLRQMPAILKNWQARAWLAPRETVAARAVAWVAAIYCSASEHFQRRSNAARRRNQLAAFSALAFVPLTTGVAFGQTRTYDAALGSLPEAQGWTFSDGGGSPAPLIAGSALHQGPTSCNEHQYWRTESLSFNFDDGFSFTMDLDIVSSTFEFVGDIQWSGYSVNISDELNRFFSVKIASNGVFLWSNVCSSPWGQTPLVAIDTTGLHTYRFMVSGGVGSLYVDSALMAALDVGPVCAVDPPSSVIFGDTGTLGCSESYLFHLSYSNQSACNDPPCFQGLGDLPGGAIESGAQALSADGTTVVGYSLSGASGTNPEAFRWRADTGLIGLGDLPGGGFNSSGEDVSADGSVVVGTSYSGSANHASYPVEGFRWTTAGGMISLGDAPGGDFFSQAQCLSDDGQIIGGETITGPDVPNAGNAPPCRWVSGIGPTPLSGTGNVTYGAAWGVSGDGSVLVGNVVFGPPTVSHGFRWTESGGLENLGDLPGGIEFADLVGANTDGTVCVGGGHSASGPEAIRWEAANGLVGLGDFPGGAFDSKARSVAASIIVGRGTSDEGSEAAMWDAALSMNRVADVLSANCVSIPSGWTLTAATDIAINGDVVTICGNATNPQGNPEAWIARYTLTPPPCPGDVNGDRVVDLSDLAILLAHFGQQSGATLEDGDLEGDGDVELADLALLLANFGTTCP